MREVAALAGVSLKTVSRVINAEPAVSDDVRSRVVGAIQRLDYRHDHAASSLRRSDRKTSTIGVLLEDVAKDRKSTRLNSSHTVISYAVFCLKQTTTRRAERSSRG